MKFDASSLRPFHKVICEINDGHGLPFDVSGSQQDMIHTVVSNPSDVSFGEFVLRAFEDVPVDSGFR
jgi:hypothetical protein